MQLYRVFRPHLVQLERRALLSTGAPKVAEAAAQQSNVKGDGDGDGEREWEKLTREEVLARRAERTRLRRERNWTKTDYLQRRDVYDEKISAARKEFSQLSKEEEEHIARQHALKMEELKQIRSDRSKRRREKSLVKVAQHKQRVEIAKQKAQERAAHGFQMWTAQQERVQNGRLDKLKTLEQASKSWITEDNLDEAIDNVVDDFMIATSRRTSIARTPPQQ